MPPIYSKEWNRITIQVHGDHRQGRTSPCEHACPLGNGIQQMHTLIAAGETTVRLEGEAGSGGPSQELALAFAQQVGDLRGIGIAAIETEGTDGPTGLAGGLTDCTTARRAREAGIDILNALDRHDCCPALTALGDHLVTGNTGTNLCDLNIIYIR